MRAGSLCTGILGLDLAVAAHFGAELAWCSEIEAAPCTVIEREHPGVPNLGDLKAIDWADVPPVDVLTAGYPCQPFSHAGKRKGTDDPRHLWPFIFEGVRALRPRHVVLENVRGHLSLGFDAVLGDLAEAGFDAEWCLLRASDVGAPHQRARLFIVASDADRGRREGWGSGEPSTKGHGREGRKRGAARDGEVATDANRVAGPTPEPEHRGPGAVGEPGAQPGAERLHRLPAPADPGGERRGHAAPADTDRGRLQERSEPHRREEEPGLEAPRRGDADGRHATHVAWGQYEPAIRRWERTIGRPAPAPVDDRGRLAPPFVEWMMGYPQGWVDGLHRTQGLKALGNAVVPQQALAALGELCPDDVMVAA